MCQEVVEHVLRDVRPFVACHDGLPERAETGYEVAGLPVELAPLDARFSVTGDQFGPSAQQEEAARSKDLKIK